MRRNMSLAVATALVIGLATGYVVWSRQQRKAEEATADEVAAAPKGESPAGSVVVASAVGAAVIEGDVQFTGTAPCTSRE